MNRDEGVARMLDQRSQQEDHAGLYHKDEGSRPVRRSGDVVLSLDAFPRSVTTLTAALGFLIVAWIGLIFAFDDVRFVVFSPTAKAGVEVILALASLFGALVLILFPAEHGQARLRWVASGFLVLGLGGLLFGYVSPLLVEDQPVNPTMYASLLTRSVAGLLFTLGLLPRRPREISPPWMGGITLVTLAAGTVLLLLGQHLPALTQTTDLQAAAGADVAALSGLTLWHWTLSLAPLALAVASAAGAARRYPGREMGAWLFIAMTLRAGSQLHTMFWPSTFTDVITTSTALRLAFTAIVLAGGALELHRIAVERAAMLAAEQEHSNRLAELTVLKADFTAMVAHELSGPLTAIARLSEMASHFDDRTVRSQALQGIQAEIAMLRSLVSDVQLTAAVERDDFLVSPQPVPVERLLAGAAEYARSLPGDHPVSTRVEHPVDVLADPERISQVLRNLLSNAAKYSPDGAPVELRAVAEDGVVRIEIVDQGYGIHANDLRRIFEKFGRGRDLGGRPVTGVGVGLYLSRRIVQAHGSELHVHSRPGAGSTFSFTLEMVDRTGNRF